MQHIQRCSVTHMCVNLPASHGFCCLRILSICKRPDATSQCLCCGTADVALCRYVLARMQEGKTDVSAEKADYQFSKLAAVSITPSAQVLPDILVKKVGICGRLSYGDAHFKQSSKKVTLTALDGSGVNMHTLADNLYKWCFLVPPGRYRVAPHVSADDKTKGLVVAPTHVDLSVNGEPELGLVFGQAKLAIHGNVVCLDGPCPDDVAVEVHVASTGTKILSGKLKDIPASEDHPASGALYLAPSFFTSPSCWLC